MNRQPRGPDKRLAQETRQKEEEEPAALEGAGPTMEDVEAGTGHRQEAAEAGRNGRGKRGGISPDMEEEAAATAAAEEVAAAEATAEEAPGDRHEEAEAGGSVDEDSEGSNLD
jgi:hypothetical protein